MAASSTESIIERLSPFHTFTLPQSNQRVLGEPHPPGTVIPLALQLSTEQATNPIEREYDNVPTSRDEIVDTTKKLAEKGVLDAALSRHGTLLFRGLPIHSADDFSRFSHAFGYKPHEIIGIVVDRPLLAKNVAPANESSLTVTIGSHNESPQVPHGEILSNRTLIKARSRLAFIFTNTVAFLVCFSSSIYFLLRTSSAREG